MKETHTIKKLLGSEENYQKKRQPSNCAKTSVHELYDERFISIVYK